MFVVVGRFRFRPMDADAWQRLMQGIARDFAPIARACPGFRSVCFSRPTNDEVMTDWHWESAADWEAAQARFGPYLQEHVIPNLAQPPERVGAAVVVEITS
jgi:hypothetical protein